MTFETIGSASLYLGDCMEYMAGLPDKAFELAIVDPPYGIGAGEMNMGGANSSRINSNKWDDAAPDQEYFDELMRVSCNQIIWGMNYFSLPPSHGVIIWDKGEFIYGRSFAEAEIAWSSFSINTKIFKFDQRLEPRKIHKCQKPVALYKWLLSHYAKTGDHILDTHGGSGSSVIACLDMGFPIVWIEKDEDYYKSALERIRTFNAQGKLFEEPKKESVPLDMFN